MKTTTTSEKTTTAVAGGQDIKRTAIEERCEKNWPRFFSSAICDTQIRPRAVLKTNQQAFVDRKHEGQAVMRVRREDERKGGIRLYHVTTATGLSRELSYNGARRALKNNNNNTKGWEAPHTHRTRRAKVVLPTKRSKSGRVSLCVNEHR